MYAIETKTIHEVEVSVYWVDCPDYFDRGWTVEAYYAEYDDSIEVVQTEYATTIEKAFEIAERNIERLTNRRD